MDTRGEISRQHICHSNDDSKRYQIHKLSIQNTEVTARTPMLT